MYDKKKHTTLFPPKNKIIVISEKELCLKGNIEEYIDHGDNIEVLDDLIGYIFGVNPSA